MNFTNKLYLCIAMLASFSSFGMMHQLICDENGFRIIDGQKEQVVQPHFIDPLLKRMSLVQLKTFVEQGNRVRAIKLDNGEYRLQAKVSGMGGGPATAMALYWITKSLCWGAVGTAAAAGTATVATAVVATGGAAGVAVGAAINAGSAALVATTAAGTTAAGVAAAALGTTAATTAVGATIAATGSVAGLIAAIEGAAAAACAFGLALPLP
ncbi:MAG TPA: hypothetical protein PKD74_04740 [Candidatus Dependentiae bacterium]|nr:hypothetical protein [Candidatus Dependentiae bacterium]